MCTRIFFKENGGKKIFVFKTIRIRVNFRSSCIPLQIIMAVGLIRTVSSLIDFVSHVFHGLDVVKRILCIFPGLLKPDGYDMKIMIAL